MTGRRKWEMINLSKPIRRRDDSASTFVSIVNLTLQVPVFFFFLLTGFCFLLRAALRNLTWTEDAESKTTYRNGLIKDRKRNAHCFGMILKAPHPSCHVLCTSSRPNDLSYCDILISFTPGRRTAFAVVFKCCVFSSTREECLLWTLKTARVAESGFRRGRYESGFNFFVVFCNTNMKGKHKSG